MGLLTELPIRQVFKHARRLRVGEETPHRSSLCVARQRLGIAPVRHLFEQVVRPLARPETPGAFYRGFRLMGIDGVGLRCPRLGRQRRRLRPPLGRAARRRGLPPGPQAQPGRVGDPRRGRLRRAALSPTANRPWSAALLRHLTAEMLLLWDRGFFSYDLWKEVTSRGVKILARVTSRLILEPIRNLADGSYLAKIYPTPDDRRKDRDGIVVRVIRYTLDDPQRVGHGEVHVLITNLFDEDLYPAKN